MNIINIKKSVNFDRFCAWCISDTIRDVYVTYDNNQQLSGSRFWSHICDLIRANILNFVYNVNAYIMIECKRKNGQMEKVRLIKKKFHLK